MSNKVVTTEVFLSLEGVQTTGLGQGTEIRGIGYKCKNGKRSGR
jgi:hypothetical protein